MGMVAGTWSMSALSVELGLSRRRIGKALEGIKPAEIKGEIKYYRLREVVQAIYSEDGSDGGKLDLTRETARLKKFQADIAEMDAALKAGELIEASDVVDKWGEFAANCRAKIVGLPSTAAPQCVGRELQEILEILQDLVEEALGELSGYGEKIENETTGRPKKTSPDSSSNVSDDGAPAKTKNKRVGRPKKDTKQRGQRRTGKVADKSGTYQKGIAPA